MDPNQALPFPESSSAPESPLKVIAPSQVWAQLTLGQQQYLLRTIVRIGQDLVATSPYLPKNEVTHE
jgi:hypothetical protein